MKNLENEENFICFCFKKTLNPQEFPVNIPSDACHVSTDEMDPGSIGGYLIGHIDNCHHCTSSKDKWCTIHHTCRTTNSALNLQWV